MLKQLQKRIRERKQNKARWLAAALGTALALWLPAAGWADTGTINVTSGSQTVDQDIDTTNDYGLLIRDASATMSGHFIKAFMDGVNVGDGSVALTNVFIRTSNTVDGSGIYGIGHSTVNMAGGSITAANYGVYANNGCAVTLTDNVSIISRADSLHVNGDGSVRMTGGRLVSTGGDGAYTNSIPSAITLDNVEVQAARYALEANDGRITATVNGQSLTGGQGLLNAVASGAVSLTANNSSRLYGAALLSGGTADLTLTSGATWTNPAASTLTRLTLDGGAVVFTAPADYGAAASYKTLTVNSRLAGSGAFYLNGNLAFGYADRISGAAAVSGSHQLYVRNWGGTPDDLYTTVKLTSLTGANTAAFSGGSDVGCYRYGVAQGSTLPSAYRYAGASVSGSGDYYLYNTFEPSTPARAAVATGADSVALWYGELNEIKKRLGDLRLGTQGADDFWLRSYADKFKIKPAGVEGYSQIMRGIEVGKDNPQPFAGGKKFTGFLAGVGQADNTYDVGGTGSAYSTYLGAYASWLRDDGAYFDLVGKYNWLRHNIDVPLLGGGSDSAVYRNKALGLSAEIGKRFQRDGGCFIEPAAELSALWSGKADYTTVNGLTVAVPAARSLQLRLGVTAGKKWTGADGATRQLYGKVSWSNEYAGDSTVRVGTLTADGGVKGHQWVTGLGFIEDRKDYQLYVDVEKSWGTSISKEWGFNLGCRWKF